MAYFELIIISMSEIIFRTVSCDNFMSQIQIVNYRPNKQGLCKAWMWTADAGGERRMRTADNYKIRKIRKDRSFSSFNLSMRAGFNSKVTRTKTS